MIRAIFVGGAAVLLCGSVPAVAQRADPPLAPSGKWVANYADAMCILARDYGSGKQQVTLAFRPIPGDDSVEVFLAMPSRGRRRFRGGDAEIALTPGGQSYKSVLRDYTIPGGTRLVRMWPESTLMPALPDTSELVVKLDGKESYRFALSATGTAFKVIAMCQDDLVRSWGFDPDVLRAQRSRATPTGSPQAWVTDGDYPPLALWAGQSGITRFYVRVNTEGRVAQCVVVQSSGVPALDTKTCTLIERRARFEPATDAQGRPAEGLWANTIQWRIP